MSDIPWVYPLKGSPESLYYNSNTATYERFIDYTQTACVRYALSTSRRAFPWKAPDGIVHITERMHHGIYDAVDRVTICKAFRLNKYPEDKYPQGLLDRRALDIVPCKEPVTCIICIGLKDFTDE